MQNELIGLILSKDEVGIEDYLGKEQIVHYLN